jgi:competence protein ComEC
VGLKERLSVVRSRITVYPMPTVFVLCMAGMGGAQLLPASAAWFDPLCLAVAGLCLLTCMRAGNLWIIATMFLAVMVAAWRCQLQERSELRDQLQSMADTRWNPVVLEGVIESIPRWRPDMMQFRDRPEVEGLRDDGGWQTVFEVTVKRVRDGRDWRAGDFGRMLLTAQGRQRSLLPGDRILGMLEWQRIPEPTNPGQFDLAAKYRRLGIFVRGRTESPTQVRWQSRETLWRLDRWLAWVVVEADKAFHQQIAFNQAALASALVLGQREQVEWELQESLLATGTIHMLAISGMHIEMVAVSVFGLCLLLGCQRKFILLATVIVVVAYSLLCGANPPVARAAIVVVLSCWARWIGKTTRSFNLLGLAAVGVYLYRPNYWMEIGTQLSFLAVAVLILLSPSSRTHGQRPGSVDDVLAAAQPLAKRRLMGGLTWIMQIALTSFWVWWLTAPLVWYRFHIVSPVAVLLNLALWLPLLIALLTGLVLLVVGPWSSWLGYPLGWLCGLNLELTDQTVRWAETMPLSHFWLASPSLSWLLVFYASFALLVALQGFARRERFLFFIFSWLWLGGVIGSWSAAGSWWPAAAASTRPGRLEIIFIDVGHGTSVLMQTPSGETWLYDAGSLGNAQRGYQEIANVLWDAGVDRIDGLVLSHADADHFNAVPGLSKRFKIRQVVTTDFTLKSASQGIQEVLVELRSRGVPRIARQAGESFGDEQVCFRVLHPPPDMHSGKDNAKSLCLLLECYGRRILLPGDLEGEGVRELLTNPRRKVALYMAPHHGSLVENPQPLLDWCEPEIVVISGGPRGASERVKPAFGAPRRVVLNTATEHAIRLVVRQDGQLQLDRWVYPKWQNIPLKASF